MLKPFCLILACLLIAGQPAVSAPAKQAGPAPVRRAGAASQAQAPRPAATAQAPRPAATAQAPRPASRIAVLRFSGPEIWDLDADEIWKAKTHFNEPTRGELSAVPDALQKALTESLASRLGAAVVPLAELKGAEAKTELAVSAGGRYTSLARPLAAKYFVSGQIERIEFDGNTILEDVYVLFPSASIIDAATGATVWSYPMQKYSKKLDTAKTGKTVMQVFSDVVIPDIASDMSVQIAQALGR